MKNQHVIITGADGMVGSYANFGIRLGHKELDVTDFTAVHAAFEKYLPVAVIHLAAITDHTMCEADPARAYMVNAIGAYHVALAARTVGAHMLLVSTNAVFSGLGEKAFDTSDVPDPQNVYGRSKYAGEGLVRSVLPKALVARTSWIFGGGPQKDKKFIGTIAQKIRLGASEIKATVDVTGTPTYAKDAMGAFTHLVEEKKSGVVHLTNAGTASRYDMALSVREALKSSISIVAVSASSSNNHSVKNEALTGKTMRPWRDALKEYLETEWN